jgi:dihydroorotase
MVDLPTCMTKLLALAMPLTEVVAAATATPARLIGAPELGTLHVGGPADVALLAREPGPFRIRDVNGEERSAPVRLRAARTFVAGRELALRPVPLPPPWIELTERQRAIREAAARGEAVDLAAELDEVVPLPPLADV